MRTLMFTVFAAAFVLLTASAVSAGMMSSNELASIDSSNLTVVSISAPASPIVASSGNTVSLDSNGLWLASDYSGVSSGHEMASTSISNKSSGNLYCFDSTSRFCAVAY